MAGDNELFSERLSGFIDRARVECENLFTFQCSKYWGDLAPTDDPTVRRCNECQQPVYLVATEALLRERAMRGECVAIVLPSELPSKDDQTIEVPRMLGMIAPPRDW